MANLIEQLERDRVRRAEQAVLNEGIAIGLIPKNGVYLSDGCDNDTNAVDYVEPVSDYTEIRINLHNDTITKLHEISDKCFTNVDALIGRAIHDYISRYKAEK
jgi:urease alpha subunit